MRIWTEAAKQAQREAIKRWKPWSKSTGPRTETGKTRSSHNARKADRPSIKGLNTLNKSPDRPKPQSKSHKSLCLLAKRRKKRKTNYYDGLSPQRLSDRRTGLLPRAYRLVRH